MNCYACRTRIEAASAVMVYNPSVKFANGNRPLLPTTVYAHSRCVAVCDSVLMLLGYRYNKHLHRNGYR